MKRTPAPVRGAAAAAPTAPSVPAGDQPSAPPAPAGDEPTAPAGEQPADRSAQEPAAPAAPSEETVDAPATTETPARVVVRVLVSHGDHLPNAVIEIAAEELIALTDAGVVDDHPDAVAYALSLVE